MSLRRDCVSGILVQNRLFLVEKRGKNDVDPGYALPGGHVEHGETLENALRREMLEELELNIDSPEYVWTGNHTASDGEQQRIHYFLVRGWKGNPIVREAESIDWTGDISILTFEVDRKAVEKLIMNKQLEV